MKAVLIPSTIPKDGSGPHILAYEDEGGLTGGEKVRIAIYFDKKKKAEKYSEKIVKGKNAKLEIYPIKAL